MTTTGDRLAVLEQHMATTTALLADIHLAVVGNGSAGSSLRERVASIEAHTKAHESSHRWSAARSIVLAAATAISTAISLKITVF